MTTTDAFAELLNRLNHPPSERMLRILRKLVTHEDGRLLLELPASPAELAERLRMKEETVTAKLHELEEKGVAIKTRRGVRLAHDAYQLHSATLTSSEKWVDTELLDLWKDYYEAEWFPSMEGVWEHAPVKAVKVLPAVKAIERSPGLSEDNLAPEENIREVIKTAELRSVVPCACRRKLRRCDRPLRVCLQFNKAAEYAISRGAGPKLSVEEAIAIANEAEEAGLIHTRTIWLGPELREICNCCGDCCMYFDPAIRYGGVNQSLEKSRFRAEVKLDPCTGCQDCVESCNLGAVEMKKVPLSKKLKASINQEQCVGCGSCVVACKTGALTMKQFEPVKGTI